MTHTPMIPASIDAVFQRSSQIFSEEQIQKAIDRMAEQISQQLYDQNPVLLCVMIGGLVLTGNLMTRLNFPLELDYIHATRYQGATSGGEIHWKSTPKASLRDRCVLIIDDILDQGLTLKAIYDYCAEQGARDIRSAVLVDKYTARKPEGLSQADFVGLAIEDFYIFGYGMDYQEYLRNAPGIYRVAEQDM